MNIVKRFMGGKTQIAILSIILALLLWELAYIFFSALVASPLSVWQALTDGFVQGTLIEDILVSLARVLGGFFLALILSIILGFIFGWYSLPRVLFGPWFQFLRMVPPIALIPLVIVYLGVGEAAKVFVIFLASFLVMLVTIYQGVIQVDATLIRAARVLGADDLFLFFRVIMPATVPYIFTAIRLGISTAWTTLVASELIAASSGLGFMIEQASNYFEIPKVYLGIACIGVIGILMDQGILWLEKKLTSWQVKV